MKTGKMNSIDNPISRDAGDKTKGPRLQKFRALELLFEACELEGVSHVYIATEFEGDVSIHVASNQDSSVYVEENKNYDGEKAFTFNSKQVLNTLVSFLDSWIGWQCDSSVGFGFYCPNEIGKERNIERTKKLGITWPEKAILKTLEEGKDLEDSLVDDLSALVKDEYDKQYKGKESNGYQTLLNGWGTEEWKSFFKTIQWKLGEVDDKDLKATVVDLIKKSEHYREQHAGKEEMIAAAAVELLDERQALTKPTERFVYSSDIAMLFMTIASSDPKKLPDPAWQMWESLDPPTDTRNIKGKVQAVSKSSPTLIGRWSRKAASGFTTQNDYGTDKSILALKYRIYTACSDRWDEFLEAHPTKEADPKAIRKWVTDVAKYCCEVVQDLEVNHRYAVSNTVFIEELIWVLIDECYLSFDAEPAA